MKKTENKALNIALNQQNKINKQVTDQLSSITTNQDTEKKALDEMSEKIDKLSAPKRKNGWKIFFKSTVAVVAWGIPLFITVLIYFNTQGLSEFNSNLITEAANIKIDKKTQYEYSLTDESMLYFYVLSANLSITPQLNQGSVKAAYYIFPETAGINPSSFNLANKNKDTFTHFVYQHSTNNFQVLPFYMLIIDNNNNKLIQYYQIITNSNIYNNVSADSERKFGKLSIQLIKPKDILLTYIDSRQLIDSNSYINKNKKITKYYQSNKLDKEDGLKLKDALINQDKILADVKKIKEIYSSVYE
ncbi:hypothetical protein [Listeria booriae]|uniref:hypothetical protein n=1 Tax=Listeria booriae TaxID=1552123 RepID=UPI00162454A2|nr:hypothetical protein [Listeria booriae]MBC1982661.1 hypothetical protein [Listeria booriae]